MQRCHTPVTLGAPEFTSLEVGPLRVTDAHFPPGSLLEPHVHARHVFAVILDGSFDDVFPNRTLECIPATVLVEPAEDKHANRFGNMGAHVLIVEPDPTQEDLLHPCRDLFFEPISFISPAVANIAVRLSHEVHSRDAFTPLAVEGLALELFVEASRRAQRDTMHAPIPPWLARVTDYLHDSFQQQIRISDVAAVGEVHPTHLARMFRKHHGVTVGHYVRRLRLLWTAKRLRNREKGLSQIAAEAGFTDQSHFTRVFKAEFSVTPAEYRKHSALNAKTR